MQIYFPKYALPLIGDRAKVMLSIRIIVISKIVKGAYSRHDLVDGFWPHIHDAGCRHMSTHNLETPEAIV